MKGIDYIRQLPAGEIAKAIIKYGIGEYAYCNGDCGAVDGEPGNWDCKDEIGCCIKWLEEEVK